jgi:hypothetical protein
MALRMGSYSMSACEALLMVSSKRGPASIKSEDIIDTVSSVRCVTVVAVDRSVMSQSSSVTYDDALLTRLRCVFVCGRSVRVGVSVCCICVCVCVRARACRGRQSIQYTVELLYTQCTRLNRLRVDRGRYV